MGVLWCHCFSRQIIPSINNHHTLPMSCFASSKMAIKPVTLKGSHIETITTQAECTSGHMSALTFYPCCLFRNTHAWFPFNHMNFLYAHPCELSLFVAWIAADTQHAWLPIASCNQSNHLIGFLWTLILSSSYEYLWTFII